MRLALSPAAIDVPRSRHPAKSKLIAAILDSGKFEVSDEPTPVEVPDIVRSVPSSRFCRDQ